MKKLLIILILVFCLGCTAQQKGTRVPFSSPTSMSNKDLEFQLSFYNKELQKPELYMPHKPAVFQLNNILFPLRTMDKKEYSEML